jgi:uncharacterized protein YjbJ (UPF0337 family)
MTDEHIKGTVSQAQGMAEQAFGKLTGDRRRQGRGRARQVQGSAQKGLGDLQNAVGGTRTVANLATVALVLIGVLVLVLAVNMVGSSHRPGTDAGAGEGI